MHRGKHLPQVITPQIRNLVIQKIQHLNPGVLDQILTERVDPLILGAYFP